MYSEVSLLVIVLVYTDWLRLGAGLVYPVQSSLSHDGTSWSFGGIGHRIRKVFYKDRYRQTDVLDIFHTAPGSRELGLTAFVK